MNNFVEICLLLSLSITKLNPVKHAYYIYESRFIKECGTKGEGVFENSIIYTTQLFCRNKITGSSELSVAYKYVV